MIDSKTFSILLCSGVFGCIATVSAQMMERKDEKTPPSMAQVGLPGATRFGTDPLQLLQTPKVKQALNITPEQSGKLAKIAAKYNQQASTKLTSAQANGLGAAADREATDQIIESSRKEVAQVLNSQQLDRLKQILLQVDGAEALQDKEVAKEVGITPAQKSKLQQAQMAQDQRFIGVVQRPHADANGTQPFAANVRSAGKIDAETRDQTLGVVTPEQKQKLQSMQGAPFKLTHDDVVMH